MHSRAFLLLRRDLINLESFPLTGIVAHPQNDNIFTWNAKIEGLIGTLWEGGIFQLSLSFTEDYNLKPPEIHFMTIPFHPNVDPRDGSPALSHYNCDEETTIPSILLSLQALISNPELDDEGCIRNSDAARMLREAPITYRQMALDCITASLRVDAGLSPYENEDECSTHVVSERPYTANSTVTTAHTAPHTAATTAAITTAATTTTLDGCNDGREGKDRVNLVSFDDYHALWRGIATSITGYKPSDDFAGVLEGDQYLNQVHARGEIVLGVQHKPPIETAPLEQRVHKHILLKYGKSNGKQPPPEVLKSRTQRINHLRKMYAGKGIGGYEDGGYEDAVSHIHKEGEEELDEVDQLVEWTQNLDEQLLSTTPFY